MSKFYTGIGSRSVPPAIYKKMVVLAEMLANRGYTLRSGAAAGSDTAFEDGCDNVDGPKEIYLPWKDFNRHSSPFYHISDEAFEIAMEIFGSQLKYMKYWTQKFMSRDMYQVTGETLDTPSDFVVCWTSDGCETQATRKRSTGGTGQAIAYASSLGIPVFNLQNPQSAELLEDFLKDTK